MKSVLFAAEMAEVDAKAQAEVSMSTLIERAGAAVARLAMDILGSAYGRRVVVVAGKGHNGDDGRVAARFLARRGAKVRVVEVGELTVIPDGTDLVIDAAFGTGFHGDYDAPRVQAGVPVLAVDIPSGLSADLGQASAGAVRASHTVTFGAIKPGLLFGSGPALVGACVLEAIGLDPGVPKLHLVEDLDLDSIPARDRDAHKWKSALFILAGSPAMRGAADLSVEGALRAGAGMVRTGSPGVRLGASRSKEAVVIGLSADDFSDDVEVELKRCKALVVGPGLGLGDENRSELVKLLSATSIPVLLDADALTLLGNRDEAAAICRARTGPTILTPHDGEFARIAGQAPGVDRLASVRSLAADLSATVLLKGATTIVANPDGTTLLVTAGTPRLATAGSGDVLSGIIGALMARGMEPLFAGGIGAHLHARAAHRGLSDGLVAGDLPRLVAGVLSQRQSES
jgi:NAD(P)H-hydrate epimerase